MLSFLINHVFLSENKQSYFNSEMEPNEEQLQSVGICHRLFCYIMKTLAAQAVKPVTLGAPSTPGKSLQKLLHSSTDRSTELPLAHGLASTEPQGSNVRDEDTESVASIDIEDTTCLVHYAVQDSSCQDKVKVTFEILDEHEVKAPRKMVSIKDEPEIINLGNKKRKTLVEMHKSSLEREKQKELRPLRSILKVGSNLGESSDVNVKPTMDSTTA